MNKTGSDLTACIDSYIYIFMYYYLLILDLFRSFLNQRIRAYGFAFKTDQ